MEIINYISTTLTAVIIIYIAWQQYRVNRDKHKFELFEKRYKVYTGLTTLLQQIVSQADLQLEQISVFEKNTNENIFFFNKDINNYLIEVRKRAYEFQLARHRLFRSDNPALGSEAENFRKISEDHLFWFLKQSEIVPTKFSKYLKID